MYCDNIAAIYCQKPCILVRDVIKKQENACFTAENVGRIFSNNDIEFEGSKEIIAIISQLLVC